MEPQGAFGHVNDSIRKLATEGPATETWEFFCECPDLACHTLVTLTLVEFDERRAASPPAPIVATHHDTRAEQDARKEAGGGNRTRVTSLEG
jgi:hypothetical protein